MKFIIGICSYADGGLEELLGKLVSYNFNNKLVKIILIHNPGKIPDSNKILEIVEEKPSGKTNCVNTIIKLSKKFEADAFVMLAGDVSVTCKSIDRLLDNFSKINSDIICSRPFVKGKGLWNSFGSFFWDLHHEFSINHPKVCGELFVVRKDLLRKIPGNIINEDYYIQKNWVLNGITYDSSIRVKIFFPSFRDFFLQRKRINQGFIQIKKPFRPVYVKTLVKFFIKNPFFMLFLFFVELFSKIAAKIDFLNGDIAYNWKK